MPSAHQYSLNIHFTPPISQSNANSPTLFSSFIRKFAAFPSIHPPPNFLFHFPFLAFPFLHFLCTEMTTATSNSTKIQHPNESTAIKMSNHHSSSRSTMRNSSSFFAISLIFIFITFLATFPKSTEARAPFFPMMGQNYADSMEGTNNGNLHTMNKRRLVVRVPFAQNPDGHQLSRIYKSLFEPSNSRAKKQPWTYSLRHFVAGPTEEE